MLVTPSQPLALFVCRRNTGPSIMAEAILRHLAEGRVRAASAGAVAAGPVNPYALECLRVHGIETAGLQAKRWGRFFGLGKPPVRFVIALCDLKAAKAEWPYQTLISTWNMPDPVEVVGSEIDIRLAFEEAYGKLLARIRMFLALPLEELDDKALVQALARIAVLPQ